MIKKKNVKSKLISPSSSLRAEGSSPSSSARLRAQPVGPRPPRPPLPQTRGSAWPSTMSCFVVGLNKGRSELLGVLVGGVIRTTPLHRGLRRMMGERSPGGAVPDRHQHTVSDGQGGGGEKTRSSLLCGLMIMEYVAKERGGNQCCVAVENFCASETVYV